MGQNSALDYAVATQAQLASIVTPIPVYAAFNRNWATQPKFVTWMIRDIHQPVYTGPNGGKGIDTPIVQISVFAQTIEDSFTIAQDIIDSLHGYAGQYGGVTGFYLTKADVQWLYNSFDSDTKMAQVFLDCTLYIQT